MKWGVAAERVAAWWVGFEMPGGGGGVRLGGPPSGGAWVDGGGAYGSSCHIYFGSWHRKVGIEKVAWIWEVGMDR